MLLNPRSLGYALLRITIGFVIFFWGLRKFTGGYSQFVSGIENQFSNSWLPRFAVDVFALILPFTEVIFGLLLIFGLFTVYAAALEAIFVMALNTGMQISGDSATVANNLIYTLILCTLVFLADYDYFSLDSKLKRRRSAS
ncbi:MAG TPA: DoxX family protein [Candidatus Acidoferrales bacterium]|nr:DoxX family protein [Candidatus Acidoferrales bacterium]